MTRRASEPMDARGSGTLLVVGVLAVATTVAMATVVIAAYVGAAHRARAAADLVALSAATTVAQGGDGCQAAGRLARHNEVDLVDCSEAGDQIDFVVTVRVRLDVSHRLPGLPRAVEGLAHAGRLE